MDRDSVLRLVVATGAALLALAGLVASVALEIRGVATPPFVAGLAGTAIGVLSSTLTGMPRPAEAQKKEQQP